MLAISRSAFCLFRLTRLANFSTTAAVKEVRLLSKEKRLRLSYDDGHTCLLSAEYLRTQSPSAQTQARKVVSGRRFVGIMTIEPIGNYAIKIRFDDLHDSGIYSFGYLRQLCDEKLPRMRQYLKSLKALGSSRTPSRSPTPRTPTTTVSPPTTQTQTPPQTNCNNHNHSHNHKQQ